MQTRYKVMVLTLKYLLEIIGIRLRKQGKQSM